jgi:hypothetical protein
VIEVTLDRGILRLLLFIQAFTRQSRCQEKRERFPNLVRTTAKEGRLLLGPRSQYITPEVS